MKKIFLALVAVAVLGSCSSDDSSTPVNPSVNVVGTWKEVAHTQDDQWVPSECSSFYTTSLVAYRADGSFDFDTTCNGGDAELLTGTYTVQGDVVIMEPQNFDILYSKVSVEGDVMIMHPYEIVDGQNEYFNKIKLERID